MQDLETFLLKTGRTLSQMALYAPDHPSVKNAVGESYLMLSALLNGNSELAMGLSEGELVINGQPIENVNDSALRPFVQLLSAYNLFSLSFLDGIREDEMIAFFRLASGDLKKKNIDIASFLEQQNVSHIKLNLSKYAKIGEDQSIGGKEGEKTGGSDDGSFVRQMENLTLHELLNRLIEKSIIDPSDREKVFSKALGLVKQQIDQAIEKATVEFNREKTRITNERERAESVVENMAEGVVMVDDTGKVVMMNMAAEAMYGVKLTQCVGKPLWETLKEEQMVSLARDLTVPVDRPITKEVQIHGSEDVKKTLRASSAAIQDPHGRVVGMISVLSDVTKQKELTRMQNEFMANVTHDLRAPIHALKLAVQAILEGSAGPVSTEQNKMLSVADRNVDRLSRLIDDLLDFSKMEAGHMEIHPQAMALPPLLREAVSSLESWAKNHGVSLTYQEEKELPAVFADGDRIIQVVNNLISNAIKFTPAGGRVVVGAVPFNENGKNMVLVSVEDSGSGIPKESQKKIFERFIQVGQNTKTDIRGTGLGLSICKGFVELHKGRLWVESPPPHGEKGSLFCFTLPAEKKTVAVVSNEPKPGVVVQKKKESFWSKVMSKFRVFCLLSLLFAGTASAAKPLTGRVRRVVEPTLLQLTNGTMVRCLGIDAPSKGSSAYTEALAASRNYVENKNVHLRYGLQERGADGIWLAYVFVDGLFVNRELVKNGLALVSPLPNEERYLADLIRAEREALRDKKGLWVDSVIEPYPVRVQKKSGLPPQRDQ